MNHEMTKFFSIVLFLWAASPLGALAAEAAGSGEGAPPAASTEVNAPAAAGTAENAASTATSASAGAGAPATAEGGKRAKVEIGARTSQWLDTQREGRSAGNLLPIPGAEAGLSYRRYIESFGKPIPDQLGYSGSTSTASSTSGTSK